MPISFRFTRKPPIFPSTKRVNAVLKEIAILSKKKKNFVRNQVVAVVVVNVVVVVEETAQHKAIISYWNSD